MGIGGVPAWDDLRFPAQGINPPGAASDPDVDVDTGLLLFDAAKTETIAGVAQMPHSWIEGSDVKPHVHWTKTTSTAGDVLWQLDYEIVGVWEVFQNLYPGQSQQSELAGGRGTVTAGFHGITPLDWIEMRGQEISTCIFWKLSRIGGDALDTYLADARLIEFDIHYQMDSQGSHLEFVK